jgi:hypothetical protein
MARKRSKSRPPLYLVQRTSWDLWPWPGHDGPPCCEHLNDMGGVSMPGDDVAGVPVAAFTSRQNAEAACAALSAEARAVVSPLLFAPAYELSRVSSHSEEAWAARLREVGLTPPSEAKFPDSFGGINWHAWWEAVVDHLSDDQRQAIWGLCDQVRLYHVVEIIPEP